MSDLYDGVATPDPERAKLLRSVFRPSPLQEVAEAISVASEKFHDFYVERRGDQWRWSFVTRGGPYPLLRITARFLQMDPYSLGGVGSRVVGDGYCVQIVQDEEVEPDAWAILKFEQRVNRPGNCGDFRAWKGRRNVHTKEEASSARAEASASSLPAPLSAGAEGSGGPYGPTAPSGGSR